MPHEMGRYARRRSRPILRPMPAQRLQPVGTFAGRSRATHHGKRGPALHFVLSTGRRHSADTGLPGWLADGEEGGRSSGGGGCSGAGRAAPRRHGPGEVRSASRRGFTQKRSAVPVGAGEVRSAAGANRRQAYDRRRAVRTSDNVESMTRVVRVLLAARRTRNREPIQRA